VVAGLKTKVLLALSLGLSNIARAVTYRLGLRLGLNPVRRLRGQPPTGPFFTLSILPALTLPVVTNWDTSAQLFSRWPLALSDGPPDWLANPLTGQRMPAPERLWFKIPDFDPAVGDIKLIWELSRMDWAVALAQRVRQAEPGALDRLHVWLADWCMHNPPYHGPNWKCGQEASIRVMHLACAALILGQVRESAASLIGLIALHLQRIAPTLQYAIAQDNNHGTSEAAALFIGGTWLALHGDPRGSRWARSGRHWLENRAQRLIGEQGSFSQYSMNYHRVMLDTFSMTEVWRRALGLPAFSATWNTRVLAAARWLHSLTEPSTGDGPNVGANDGARLLQLTNTTYRDHRPSVQLAMVLFGGVRAYVERGPWDHGVLWLGLSLPDGTLAAPASLQADDGGFMVMRRGAALALLRYPRFRFRPSQADALHVDLWFDGHPRLRDAGTFSYNTENRWIQYFGGTIGHNTVQFDDRDQMPRLSRFLFGDWLRTELLESLHSTETGLQAGAGYRDSAGARHHRRVTLEDNRLVVVDHVQGFAHRAVLRWRMAPGEWQLEPLTYIDAGYSWRVTNNNGHCLIVRSCAPVMRCSLEQGWESLHYLEKTPVPVLELEIAQPGSLTTEYYWRV
jgi:hypothetical protein